ncbi:MAG: 23S rRNA (adenine(2030)-N(6))-methyltransferase RlmJ [Gammaproteobacteria bacterium]|nr:23S rRNA (adenine(2030)-N(6))-methyltransferase RlmJ [Gammaproteobacteria bacterium]
MNYRHLYHAGSPHDVFKHSVLLALAKALLKKEKPFCYLDTHAGIGRYDLKSIAAQKTGESAEGIERLAALTQSGLELPPLLASFLSLVKGFNPKDKLSIYPGSPSIMRAQLRAQDRMQLCELHPEDAQTLMHEFQDDRQVRVHHLDGYQALKALLPPLQTRALVLIDPPYEKDDEFAQIEAGLREALKRMAHGIYAVWYPKKGHYPVERFIKKVRALFENELLNIELNLPSNTVGLSSSGMLILNPPWQLEESVKPALNWLINHLPLTGKGHFSYELSPGVNP